MENVSEESKERVAIYATYSLLYINDMVCNEVLSLSKIIETKDKETKKIYGALKKRARKYLDFVNEVIGDRNLYYAEYCSSMDDLSDEKLLEFKESVVNALRDNKIPEYEFNARVEIVKILSHHAVTSAKYLIDAAKKVIPSANSLNQYVLHEVKRVSENLSKWLTLYYKIPNTIVISDSNIINKITSLNEVLLSYEPFAQSYKMANEANYDELNKLI